MIGKNSPASSAGPELIQARTILTSTGGYLHGYTHSLNAYLGCAFGKDSCPFCYVRAMPVQRFAGRPWGSWLKAKINAPELLERELNRTRRNGSFGALRIFMSSSTDPYQGAEARLQLTRQLLSVFARSGNFGQLVIQTRSPLVERDLDLLAHLGPRVTVSLTIETNREEVRRAITPTSPSIPRRLRTLARLGQAGIATQAALSPLLPCDPPAFADQIAAVTSRATVDTLIDGDGNAGRRSRALGMPAILTSLGYPEWFDNSPSREMLQLLRDRLGHEMVGFSTAGFNSLGALCPTPGPIWPS